MEAALEARAVMTDEEDETPTQGGDTSVDMDDELEHLDDDDDDDVPMTEEEDDEDEDDASKSKAAARTKSPSKGKKKAARTATDDEEDDEEEMKEDTADEDDDEEEEEEDDEEDDEDDETKRFEKEEEEEVAKEEVSKIDLSDPKSMLRMIRSLPELEARRHEHFRRSHFDRGAMKRIMAKAIQESLAADRKVPSVTQVMVIVMAGMTKSFVGELTAEARRVMERNGETGPIEPRHLREAQRKFYKRRPLARGRSQRRLLR